MTETETSREARVGEQGEVSTWWRVKWQEVEPVPVKRESDAFVWADEWGSGKFRRTDKRSRWVVYFRTEVEARTHLRDRLAAHVESLKDELQRARSVLGEAESALRAAMKRNEQGGAS